MDLPQYIFPVWLKSWGCLFSHACIRSSEKYDNIWQSDILQMTGSADVVYITKRHGKRQKQDQGRNLRGLGGRRPQRKRKKEKRKKTGKKKKEKKEERKKEGNYE